MQQMNDFHTPEGAKRDLAPGDKHFSIRDLCDAFDVTPRALRFYESQGLINPQRDGQRRIYTLRDRARLFLVLRGKRFGFSLAELRELLDLYDAGDRQYKQLVATLDSCYGKLEMLEERRRELSDAIGELETIIDGLKTAKVEIETADPSVMSDEAAVEPKPVAGAKRKAPLFGELPQMSKGATLKSVVD